MFVSRKSMHVGYLFMVMNIKKSSVYPITWIELIYAYFVHTDSVLASQLLLKHID